MAKLIQPAQNFCGLVMIVKKIKQTNTDKPKEWQISDLIDYIRDPGRKGEGERVEYQGALNFLSDKPVTQKVEMIALARENNRTKTAVNHWLFSWPEGEQPTHEQVDELVKFFLDEMGLADHQAIYALHCDTRNYHVHIAVNRIHPLTEKAIRVNHGFDIRQAQKIRALIEKKQGWSVLENAPYVVTEEGEVARRKTPLEPKPSQRAQDFEASTGQKSAQRIAQEKGHEIIKNAKSWDELHKGLKNIGLKFEKKGSGAIIWVGETAIKASSVDRSFSMGKLVKRLGAFAPGNYETEMPKIEPEPLNKAHGPDLKMYLEAAAKIEQRKQEAIRQEYEELAALEEKHKRQQTEIIPAVSQLGKSFMNMGRHFLKEQQREETRTLKEEHRTRLMQFAKPRFRDWMLMRGKAIIPVQPTEIEEKNRHTPAPISQPVQSPPSHQVSAFLEYSKAVNAKRYRVTSIREEADGSRKVLILDKKNGQTQGFTPKELIQRMPEIQRLRKRGENIYYTPLSENQHHILIDDVNADSLVKLQQDGYRPAVIIESSPGNFQCILTFAKFGNAFDRQIANRLTAMLNKKYGDPKLSGAIHPHRAPGFENRKEKHRRKDGTFPKAILQYAVRRDCQKALVEARKIEQELKRQAEAQTKQSITYQPISRMGPESAYFAHYADISAHITIEDFSRVDAMIALRMRANGHSPESVMAAIQICAPEIRANNQKRRDWQRYAERTVNYAFGFAGDRDLMRYERFQIMWQKIESIEEHKQRKIYLRIQ